MDPRPLHGQDPSPILKQASGLRYTSTTMRRSWGLVFILPFVIACGAKATDGARPGSDGVTGVTGPEAGSGGSGQSPIVDPPDGSSSAGASGSGAADAGPPVDERPFRCLESTGLDSPTCDAITPPADDCSVPRLVDVKMEPFSTDEFHVSITVECGAFPDHVNDVSLMGYLPSQGIWDGFHSGSWLNDVLEIREDSWTFSMNVSAIDETTLHDVETCSGWFVGLGQYAMTREVTEAAGRGVGPVMKAEEVPEGVRCTTMGYGAP